MKRFLALTSLALLLAGPAGAFTENDGWRVAAQAWTFRSSTFFETVDKLQELGVRYLEAYPGQAIGGGIEGTTHYTMDEATRQKLKDKLNEAGVTLVQYGVVGGKDEADWRSLFAFAKDMGIETITSEPAQEQLDLVEKLCDEYGVNLAIHNHPKPSRYWNPNTVLGAVKDRSRSMGICPDTGHYLRSGLDPTAVLNKVGNRVITVHLKDLAERKPKSHDVIYGTGAGDIHGQLKTLRRRGFRGVITIEYEHETPTLLDEVAGCVAYLGDWDGSGAAGKTHTTNDVRGVWATALTGPAARWSLKDIAPPKPPKPEVTVGDQDPVPAAIGTPLDFPVPEGKRRFVARATADAGPVTFTILGLKGPEDPDGAVLIRSPALPAEGVSHWNFDVNVDDHFGQVRLAAEAVGTNAATARWSGAGFLAAPGKK